jgi:hypothetical protein
MTAPDAALTIVEILTEVRIQAPRATVWETLVGDLTPWWHPAFYTDARGPQRGGFHIEPQLGGRMFEDWGEGQGLVWGNVIGLDRERFLQIVGDSSPAWGGPSRNFQTYRLEDQGAGTLLRFENVVFGRVSDSTRNSLESGWRFLFQEGLKRFCETGSIAGAPPPPES